MVLVLAKAKLYSYPLLKDYIVPKNDARFKLAPPPPPSQHHPCLGISGPIDFSFIFLESVYASWVFLHVEGNALFSLMHLLPQVVGSVVVGRAWGEKTLVAWSWEPGLLFFHSETKQFENPKFVADYPAHYGAIFVTTVGKNTTDS